MLIDPKKSALENFVALLNQRHRPENNSLWTGLSHEHLRVDVHEMLDLGAPKDLSNLTPNTIAKLTLTYSLGQPPYPLHDTYHWHRIDLEKHLETLGFPSGEKVFHTEEQYQQGPNVYPKDFNSWEEYGQSKLLELLFICPEAVELTVLTNQHKKEVLFIILAKNQNLLYRGRAVLKCDLSKTANPLPPPPTDTRLEMAGMKRGYGFAYMRP